MKKNRKVAATASNFFTSQFKLDPAKPSKQTHHRKLNTTLNSFKQQLIQQQTKRKARQNSKDKKPQIEQLKFLHHKQDNFRIPQSVTKRSLSKAKDESRLQIQKKNNQIYQHYQEIPVAKGQIDKQKQISSFTEALKSKRFNPKDALKQKIEKAALQKFNQTILKQNQQNQNVVNEKTAQSLYLLLKTARMNQMKQKNVHLKSSPSQNQEENNQLQHKQADKSQQNLKEKLRKQSSRDSQEDSKVDKSRDKEAVNNKQTLFKTFQQNQIKIPYAFVPKSNNPQPSLTIQLAKKDVIQPKEVICDDSQREKFTSNQGQSQSENLSDSFDLKQQSSIVPKKSKEQPNKPPKEEIRNRNKQIHSNSQKGLNQINAKRQSTQKTFQLLPIESKNSLEQKRQSKKQDRKDDQSVLFNVPNATTVDKQLTKKPNELLQKKQLPKQGEFLKLNNGSVEKILTPKSFEGQKPFGKQAATKINDLPKTKTDIHSKIQANYTSYGEDDSDIEEIDLKGKRASEKQLKQTVQNPILASKKPQPNKIQKLKAQQEKHSKTNIPHNEKIENKPIVNKIDKNEPKSISQPIQTNQQQKNDEQYQEDENDLYDQLAYYIERIEDIGHYRMSSKNIYKDITVSVELIKFHKICAYYMAHQFLFLSKKTCNHFKNQTLDSDFYDITSQELKELKQNGTLDEEIINLQSHIQESKTLLRKCYDQCKMYLPTEEQLLIMDGKSNHHIKCCAYLIKQFKKVYELFQKNKSNAVIVERCVYLIELYCSLKLLNGQFIKEHQEFEQIEDSIEHVEKYKSLLNC